MRAEFRLGEDRVTARLQDVVVIGAGVVGMATALTLADRGHRVTVIDGAAEAGRGTSFANGAQLSYAYTDALASPATLAQMPRLLLGRDPALRLHPSLDPDFLRWGLAFLKNGSAAHFRRNNAGGAGARDPVAPRAARACAPPQPRFRAWHAGQDHSLPLGAQLCRGAHDRRRQDRGGAEQAFLDADGAVAVEPMLAAIRPQIAGAIHTASEEVGDPYRFCIGAQAALTAGGGTSHYATQVARIDVDGRLPVAVTATGTRIAADRIILCTGADTVALARRLGVRLPIQPMKGYSITAPPGAAAPRVSITDAANRVVFARLGNRMRIAGLADLGRRDTSVEPARLAALIASARAALPDAAEYDAIESSWAGLRPMTPDSLPIIRTLAPGVIANTGHGALGWTYAAGSAERVAAIVEGEG